MPDIVSVLKAEITRLARKELKSEVTGLKKALAAHRAEIAVLRKRVSELEGEVKRTTKSISRRTSEKPVDAESQTQGGLRFRAAGMASNRKRLGLSAADFGLLVGASGQSVYAWEAGKSKPHASSLAAIAALRGIGKREVEERLAALK
ncbi:helix-turn-helix domain-containing protein [Scleromatobacter humisilvae]|uniref:HTH cro/C1-type domain-containing protein n=1 Tax=Scleromatobacter humisilvae TaxID=2897159 RepID=A0A9X1YM88_9BURK|nr:hypothetical protein [Scleromatobacter humisilvae]MCK9687343.1 hypothetical protein [Scleromatobacter humisilvae]